MFIDRLSMWMGKVFAWCILILTFAVSYEVFVRYVLHDPTAWAYDVSYIMYGGLFLMAGAYTVSRDGHVRGDFVYRMWPQRVQAMIDLTLYVLFYFPGVTALIYSGYTFARDVLALRRDQRLQPGEHSGLPAQGADPDCRRHPVPAGHLGAGPLHPLYPGRLLAGALS